MEREDAMESEEGRPLIPLVINSLGSFFFFPGISEGGFIVFLLTAEVFRLYCPSSLLIKCKQDYVVLIDKDK